MGEVKPRPGEPSAPAEAIAEASPAADRGKRTQILAAASECFLEVGFGAASMDAIAQRARVSKATVYAHFASKEELFGTIIAERCRIAFGDNSPLTLDHADVAEALRAAGRRFADLLLSPEGIAMYRLVVAESPRFPEIGRQFFAAGPSPLYERVSDYMAEANRRGWLRVEDPRLATDQFLGMLKGELFLKRILGLAAGGAERLEREIDAAVDVIMKVYAPRPPSP